MSSVKKFAMCLCAGAVASVPTISTAQSAARFTIDDASSINVVAPDTQTPGFEYVASTDGQSSTLKVNSDSFVFCANVLSDAQANLTPISLAPGHARWTLPSATDIQTMSYSGGALIASSIDSTHTPPQTLVCHVRGPQGQVYKPFSAFGDPIFLEGFESVTSVQYGNLINWLPINGFSWSQPDWTQVPTDPCNFDMTSADSPAVAEGSLCAAATGARPLTGNSAGQRSPTMWTQTVGSSFIYVARVDGRLGPQASGPNMNFGVDTDAATSANAVDIAVRDGFDSQYLSTTGTFCRLDQLPTTLTANVCSGAPIGGTTTGPGGTLATKFTLSLAQPAAPALTFYVVVIRTINPNNPPSIDTPVAAVSVMADPSTVREDAGDGFVGDNVVFGFPGSGVFPWMHPGQ